MPTLDGVNLLLRGYPNANVKDHIEEGKKIVTRLGGLALAIDQAAAYIQYKKRSDSPLVMEHFTDK
jgi:hypothetical protein